MLRPKVTILILNPDYNKYSDVPTDTSTNKPILVDLYSKQIYCSSLDITETKSGITGSFTTIRNKNDIKDKLYKSFHSTLICI
jgi:hypothetical protein